MINSGIDIIEVKRVKEAIERWGGHFTRRIFTQQELDYAYQNRFPFQHLAGRFAAKEAVSKAIGNGAATRWNEIEIFKNKNGGPEVILRGQTKVMSSKSGIKRIQISISHTRTFAVANAIVIKGSE